MLVLTRREGEGIRIANDVHIVILSNDRGQIRIGVEAPADVKIWRDEVYARLTHEEKFGSSKGADCNGK